MQAACLGLHFLGACQYDPEKPTTYFTIGQLVSVVALLVTFLGLAKPIVLFRLRTARVSIRTFKSLGAAGISCVFLSALLPLPLIPYPAWPVLGYPIFWEFLAGLILTISSICFIKITHTKAVFRRDNAQAFMEGCQSIIAKGNEETLAALAEEIEGSIRPAILECAAFLAKRREAEAAQEPIEPSTFTRTAFTLFELWSDKEFCRSVVCKVPTTAVKFFEQVRQELNQPHLIYQTQPARSFCDQLLQQAFLNHNSILYREEHYSGLGFFMPFTKAVFLDYKFVDGFYRPLQSWWPTGRDAESWQIKRYADCIYVGIDALFREQLFAWTKDGLRAGLSALAFAISGHVIRFNGRRDQDPYESQCFESIGHVVKFYADVIDHIVAYESGIPVDPEPLAEGYDLSRDNTIYGVIAHGIYDFFKSMSYLQTHEDVFRIHGMQLWLKLFGDQSRTENKAKREIRSRLVIQLNSELDSNLNGERPTLPWVTRLLICFTGLQEPVQLSEVKPGSQFINSFRQQLKEKVRLLDKDLVRKVLPSNVVYDEEAGELRMYDKGCEVGRPKLDAKSSGSIEA